MVVALSSSNGKLVPRDTFAQLRPLGWCLGCPVAAPAQRVPRSSIMAGAAILIVGSAPKANFWRHGTDCWEWMAILGCWEEGSKETSSMS